ncbi:MAG: GspH/FimT family pseudopilin [Gemmatimonadota bacterium]
MRARAGLTLYELLFVLVLIGLVAGLAAPYVDPADRAVRNAAETVESTLLMARRLAMERQHDVVVAFDLQNAAIRIHEDADDDGELEPNERVRWIEVADDIAFARGAAPAHPRVGPAPSSFSTLQTGLPALTFRRDGRVVERGGLYLTTLRAAREADDETGLATDTRVLLIEPPTGTPSWFRYHASGWERSL